jgi:hypothetical protein
LSASLDWLSKAARRKRAANSRLEILRATFLDLPTGLDTFVDATDGDVALQTAFGSLSADVHGKYIPVNAAHVGQMQHGPSSCHAAQ